MKKIIILIPVFNDWESLKKLLIEIENNTKKFPDLFIQCFVVNDASTIAKPEFEKPEKIKSLKILNMKENRGHARCNAFGIRHIVQNEKFDYLILMDGVPVYNVSHIGGLFSVFNADAIKNVRLTKGGFPARYGGRLSSVLEIDMKDGNMKEFKADATIGLISSKLMIEGPIVKDKTSFIVAGRRTYIDLFVRPFMPNNTDLTLHFYDLNAKVKVDNEMKKLFKKTSKAI